MNFDKKTNRFVWKGLERPLPKQDLLRTIHKSSGSEIERMCQSCDRYCGAKEQQAAWAIYWEDYSYYLCDDCYKKLIPRKENDKADYS